MIIAFEFNQETVRVTHYHLSAVRKLLTPSVDAWYLRTPASIDVLYIEHLIPYYRKLRKNDDCQSFENETNHLPVILRSSN